PERTTQQPLPPKPPLDLLAELTNKAGRSLRSRCPCCARANSLRPVLRELREGRPLRGWRAARCAAWG
ncbi:hypothetical protein, partial [Streptomyces chartreusis]|uniref:hypothetical protein n=1 Tax=Streptomyces chartreusis TaxID=1969 RepID=UPI00343CB0B9